MVMEKLPILGVMGSGREAHEDLAEPLGRMLAGLGVHLLTGGGRGVMTSVSRAFAQSADRRGLVLGVLPADVEDPSRSAEGYPNPWIEIALRTHLPARGDQGADLLSRNHINILTSDAVVILPGGGGTLSEARLAIEYDRPVCAFLERDDQMSELPEEIPRFFDLQSMREYVKGTLDFG